MPCLHDGACCCVLVHVWHPGSLGDEGSEALSKALVSNQTLTSFTASVGKSGVAPGSRNSVFEWSLWFGSLRLRHVR